MEPVARIWNRTICVGRPGRQHCGGSADWRGSRQRHGPRSQGHPVATSDKAYPPQLSGTVVTRLVRGFRATVQVRNANGTVQRTTQSTERLLHSFWTPGRNYRLAVSNPGFEAKEILVTIGPPGPAPLRILW